VPPLLPAAAARAFKGRRARAAGGGRDGLENRHAPGRAPDPAPGPQRRRAIIRTARGPSQRRKGQGAIGTNPVG